MTNFKILLAMGALIVLAAVVAKITFSRNRVFPLPSSSLIMAKITPLSSPTTGQTNQKEKELALADFRYPGAEVVFLGSNSLSLKSTEAAEIITTWYKGKLTDLNLNIRNFIQTNTNGNVRNYLTGTDEKRKIRVEIEKEKSALAVKILVTISESNE